MAKVDTHQGDLVGMSVGGGVAESKLTIEQAFCQYRQSLMRFLQRRLRDYDDAEDVLQETYTRLVQSYRDSLDTRTASALIFRIAANVANDLARRRHSRHAADHCSADSVELISTTPSLDSDLASKQGLALLYEAIAALPPKRRQVFLLSRVDGMTYRQISEHCNISVKMVEKHITAALAALRAVSDAK